MGAGESSHQEILTPEQKKELEQLKREAEERRDMLRRQHEERKARRSKSGAESSMIRA